MTLSWLGVTLFFWLTSELMELYGRVFAQAVNLDEELIEILSAGILTFCAVIGILVLDLFADAASDLAKEKENEKGYEKAQNDDESQDVRETAVGEKTCDSTPAPRRQFSASSLWVGKSPSGRPLTPM